MQRHDAIDCIYAMRGIEVNDLVMFAAWAALTRLTTGFRS